MPKKMPTKKPIPKKNIVIAKKPIGKISTSTIKSKTAKPGSTEKILVENFVALQKVMTHLSLRFDELSGQISKLLELFEISAKTISEKGPDFGNIEGDEKISEKLDNLVEQNRVIARGLTLLHETNYPQFKVQQQPMKQPPMQRQPMQRAIPPQRSSSQQSSGKPMLNRNEYQRSISSKQENQDETKNR